MKTIQCQSANYNRVFLGAFLAIVGGVLLLDQLNIVYIPDWLYSWPALLIIIGIYSGIKHNFSNLGWLIWVFIGGVVLVDDALPGSNIGDFAWPAGLIILGAYLIARKSFQHKA
ncbi:MAG: hypothetical protein JSU01_15390 [Bacteroidetes bacterium]|nr:hypothetical protein [Bacteroidota bacterium]